MERNKAICIAECNRLIRSYVQNLQHLINENMVLPWKTNSEEEYMCKLWAIRTLKKELIHNRDDPPLKIIEAFESEIATYTILYDKQEFVYAFDAIITLEKNLSLH